MLRRLVLGLLANERMTAQDILLLCHGLVSESLPLLTKRDRYRKHLLLKHLFFTPVCDIVCVCACREKASAQPPPDPRLPPPSCLLLPPTPKRGGQKAPVSSRTNMHILVDAGLKVRTLKHTPKPGFNSSISDFIRICFIQIICASEVICLFPSCFT